MKKRSIGAKICFWVFLTLFLTAGCLALLVANFFLDPALPPLDLVIEYQSPYTDLAPEVNLRGKVLFRKGFPLEVESLGTVDTEKLGTYSLSYSTHFLFWDGAWQKKVTVRDTVPPEISLSYQEGYYVLPNGEYEEEGYTALDNHDGDLTQKVITEEKDGAVFYSVSDSSGNKTEISRPIPYDDPIPPEITLLGEEKIFLNIGDEFSEPGFCAFDNCDGDLTGAVQISGNVDTRIAGTYRITYRVTDSYQNTAVGEREIVVVAKNNPETVDPGGKIIYLTFDDGPGPYTERLLAVLEKYNVKATFFVTDTRYNYLIGKAFREGHSIGIHTATHQYEEVYASRSAFFDDFYRMQDIIFAETGTKTDISRFPGGSSNTISHKYCPGIMTELTQLLPASGFQYFDWNVTSGDAGGTTSKTQVVQNVISGVRKNRVSVVLQHDIKKYSVDAVEEIIVWGLNNGYTFLPLTITSPAVHQRVSN